MEPTEEGTLVYPGVQGGTNWYSPSYSPRTGLFYVPVWELPNYFYKGEADYTPGLPYWGGLIQGASEEPPGRGAIRALVPETGELKWEYPLLTVPWSGVLTTAGDLAFGGTTDGQFFALDARTGEELWVAPLGGMIRHQSHHLPEPGQATPGHHRRERALQLRSWSDRGRRPAAGETYTFSGNEWSRGSRP